MSQGVVFVSYCLMNSKSIQCITTLCLLPKLLWLEVGFFSQPLEQLMDFKLLLNTTFHCCCCIIIIMVSIMFAHNVREHDISGNTLREFLHIWQKAPLDPTGEMIDPQLKVEIPVEVRFQSIILRHVSRSPLHVARIDKGKISFY